MAKKSGVARFEALRREVEAIVDAEIARVGADHLQPAPIVARYEKQVGRSTVHRWIKNRRGSGVPSHKLSKKIIETAKDRVERTGSPAAAAAETASAIVAILPRTPSVDEISGVRGSGLEVVSYLRLCVVNAQDVITHAREASTGKVKNARLLLNASELLRRCASTAAQLFESMHSVQRVERFHKAIIEEIAMESPELAERVMKRLEQMIERWNG